MTAISAFPRYHQLENFATNSTLLLFRTLCSHSYPKYEEMLNGLLEEKANKNLLLGPKFSQQEWTKKGQHSVVDGIISQQGFKLVIETKLHDGFTLAQLESHLGIFDKSHTQNILIALSQHEIDIKIAKDIRNKLETDSRNIIFVSVTYKEIIEMVSDVFGSDYEVRDIIEEYGSFCYAERLIDNKNKTLLAFSTGQSLKENLKYKIYYDPANRNHSLPFDFVGLYSNKRVSHIGKLEKIVYCDYIAGKLVATDANKVFDELTDDERNRITSIILNTDYYDLKTGNKFFLVSYFFETNYTKSSSTGIRSKRYFFLDKIEGYKPAMKIEEIALLLKDKAWE